MRNLIRKLLSRAPRPMCIRRQGAPRHLSLTIPPATLAAYNAWQCIYR